MFGVNKVIGGMWVIFGGIATLVVGVMLLYTPESTKRVPQNFVCSPESTEEKVQRATIVLTGSIEGVLPGSPYADVWVRPQTVYKGTVGSFVRFAAWPKKGATAKIGDLHFVTGTETYIWYFRPLKDGTLTTSSCYGTRRLPATGISGGEKELLESGMPR